MEFNEISTVQNICIYEAREYSLSLSRYDSSQLSPANENADDLAVRSDAALRSSAVSDIVPLLGGDSRAAN